MGKGKNELTFPKLPMEEPQYKIAVRGGRFFVDECGAGMVAGLLNSLLQTPFACNFIATVRPRIGFVLAIHTSPQSTNRRPSEIGVGE